MGERWANGKRSDMSTPSRDSGCEQRVGWVATLSVHPHETFHCCFLLERLIEEGW